MANDVKLTCLYCNETIELRDSDERPGRKEYVEVGGNDPQCDSSPNDRHSPVATLTRRTPPILTDPWD